LELRFGIYHKYDRGSQEGLELNGKLHLPVYSDDADVLGEKNTTGKNTEVLLVASRAVDLEVNAERKNYAAVCRHQNVGQNC
jgi:hypothetical protein